LLYYCGIVCLNELLLFLKNNDYGFSGIMCSSDIGNNLLIEALIPACFCRTGFTFSIYAIEYSLNTDWHWTPLSAIIKDKFNVSWLFCV